jgi:hypothetical protein
LYYSEALDRVAVEHSQGFALITFAASRREAAENGLPRRQAEPGPAPNDVFAFARAERILP